MINLETVIFDMDGVIVDSEPLQVESFNQTLQKYDVFISKYKFKRFVGKKQSEIFGLLKAEYEIEEEVPSLIARKKEIYLQLVKSRLVAMPGLKELVQWLKEREIKIGIASSSPFTDIMTVLECIQMKDQFDQIISAEKLEKGKPAPDVFLLAAEKLDTSPEKCLVIEDTSIGVMAASRAKMQCIAMPNFFTKGQDFSTANYVVQDLFEVRKILENLLLTTVEGRQII